MRTDYVNPGLPARYSDDFGDFSMVAAAQETQWAIATSQRRQAKEDAKKNAEANVVKYTPKTQPRDTDGQFRRILARLKTNLGDEATAELAKKIESTEAAQIAGNYDQMRVSSTDIIKMITGIKDGQLPKGATNNLRRGAADLGRVLAYLPIPQGDPNAKIRFSDLPPASADLVRSMVERVKKQLGFDKAEKYTKELDEYLSGARTMTSDEMAINLNKLLRVLA